MNSNPSDKNYLPIEDYIEDFVTEKDPIDNSIGINLALHRRVLNKHSQQLQIQKKSVDWIFGLVIAITIVTFVAFLELTISNFQYLGNSYKEFNKVVTSYNEEIEKLKKDLENLQKQFDEKEP